MSNKDIFNSHLSEFEPVLVAFGFKPNRVSEVCDGLTKEAFSSYYLNKEKDLRLSLGFSSWDDGLVMVDLHMYKESDGRYFFTLFDFIENHNLEDKLKYKCPAGTDFDEFLSQYFKDLEALFNNELHDQITGKVFEDHSKKQEESWHRHKMGIPEEGPSVIYEMEKKEVAEYIEKQKVKKADEN